MNRYTYICKGHPTKKRDSMRTSLITTPLAGFPLKWKRANSFHYFKHSHDFRLQFWRPLAGSNEGTLKRLIHVDSLFSTTGLTRPHQLFYFDTAMVPKTDLNGAIRFADR
jgi:hypothetical protein